MYILTYGKNDFLHAHYKKDPIAHSINYSCNPVHSITYGKLNFFCTTKVIENKNIWL